MSKGCTPLIKKIYTYLPPSYINKSPWEQELKKQWVSSCFPKSLIDTIGEEKMLSFPIIKWNDEFMGYTDYIDRLYAHHMSDPIMLGIDCYNRPFIAFRTKHKTSLTVDVLFQRYSNDKHCWSNAHCGNSGFITHCGHSRMVNDIEPLELKTSLKGIVTEGCVTIENLRTHKLC
jgi:hypothetical protein